SCQQFRAFLLDLAKAVTPENIILFGHSHGARLVHAALTDCEFRGELPGAFPGKFNNVVYAAPDIDTDQFLQSFQQLASVASKVTIYASDKDFALDASGNLARGGLPRLGVGGPNMTVVAGVDSVDASDLPGIEAEFGHAYAFLDETVMADVKATLEGAPSHPCRSGDAASGFRLVSNCL
ncbi:MAG: alpha/beta hydrolase, partial [Devosia sp.]|nr:alpha/beta hydrolase [Devosia sp.]